MRFCYCGECEAVVEETVTMVRWFESDFCNTKCLNKFIRKNATACHECRKELAAHPIHAIKSINATAAEPHSVESMVDGQPTLAFASAPLFATKYFCSADCLRAHKVKAVMCEYCLKPTVAKAKATSGAGAVEAGGHRNVAFCSEECRLLMQMSYNNHRLFVGVCDNCAKKANITQRCLVDGIDYTMCSFGCRFEFENKNEVNLGKLSKNAGWWSGLMKNHFRSHSHSGSMVQRRATSARATLPTRTARRSSSWTWTATWCFAAPSAWCAI